MPESQELLTRVKHTALGLAVLAMTALGAYSADTAVEAYRTYEQTQSFSKNWEQIDQEKFYPYRIEKRKHPLNPESYYWIRRLRKPDQFELVLAEGIIPTFRLVDKDGFDIQTNNISAEKLRKIYAEADIRITKEQAEKLVLPPVDRNTKPLTIEDKGVKKIIVFGDSWGVWGGNIYSIPNLLEILLKLSKYDVQVLNASVLGGNIYDLPEDIEEKLSQPDTLFVPFIQPDTDFSDDMDRLKIPPEQQPSQLMYFFAQDEDINLPQVIKHEILKDARYTHLGNILQILWYLQGKRNNHPVSRLINDPDFRNHPYFDGFREITGGATTIPVLLPPVWMIEPFREEDFPIFQEEIKRQLGEEVIVPKFPDVQTKLDGRAHPTPDGALSMAVQIYKGITGKRPPEEVVEQTKGVMNQRIWTMLEILQQELPDTQNFTPLLPDLIVNHPN